jgi:hypothetical protein
VLTRRYYGNLGLSQVTVREAAGFRFVTADHTGPRGVTLVVTTAVDFGSLPDAIAAAGTLTEGVAEHGLVADLYVHWTDQPDTDAMAERLGQVLAGRQLPAGVRRITTTVASTSGAVIHHHFTFRPDGAGFAEDRLIRGMHPQVAQRLQLHRLREFNLTRLPSADEEIYLFKAVARSNPADERLIVMGQIRDLTPLRETDGRLVSLPSVENAITAGLDAIRTVQMQRPENRRYDTNRIILFVWPTIDLVPEELQALAQRILPTTAGAGLEEVDFLARQRTADGELAEVAVRVTLGSAGHGARLARRAAPIRTGAAVWTTSGRRCCERPGPAGTCTVRADRAARGPGRPLRRVRPR